MPDALSRPNLEMVALDYFRRLGHDNHRRLSKLYAWEENWSTTDRTVLQVDHQFGVIAKRHRGNMSRLESGCAEVAGKIVGFGFSAPSCNPLKLVGLGGLEPPTSPLSERRELVLTTTYKTAGTAKGRLSR